MKQQYQVLIEMNDGTKDGTFFYTTEQAAIMAVKEKLESTTRYYKRDGVSFGEQGKLFSYVEDHKGVKKATLYVIEKTPIKELEL